MSDEGFPLSDPNLSISGRLPPPTPTPGVDAFGNSQSPFGAIPTEVQSFADFANRGSLVGDSPLAVDGFSATPADVVRGRLTPRTELGSSMLSQRAELMRPDVLKLKADESAVLDMSASIIDPLVLGLKPEDVTDKKIIINGEIVLGEPQTNPVTNQVTSPSRVYVVAVMYNNGRKEVFLVAPPNGNEKRPWVTLQPKIPLQLGRQAAQKGTPSVDGTGLGIVFTDVVSRKHLVIENTGTGVRVTDTSKHGTTIVGRIMPETIAPTTPSPSGLIDGVPKTAAEASAALDAPDKAREAEINAKVDAILARMEILKEGLSEIDKTNLWKYASGSVTSQEKHAQGQHQEGLNQAQNAGAASSALSPQAREVMFEYERLMSEKARLLQPRLPR